MGNKEKKIINKDLIIKYFDGELSEEELKQFNYELNNNPEFKEEYQLQKRILEALGKDDEIELSLRIPLVALKGSKAGLARNYSGHWRLIGYGEII